MVCPPSLTWMNFISGFDEKELLKTGMDRTQLLDFVNSYNSSRFGETDDKQIERLSTLLDDISNSIATKGQA